MGRYRKFAVHNSFLYRLRLAADGIACFFGAAVILKERELAAMNCEPTPAIASSFAKNVSTAHV